MYTCNYKLFKYFKSNLHQNKLVLINVEKESHMQMYTLTQENTKKK